jgi:hypothetical protein
MVRKKPGGKQPTRLSLSRASRLLTSAVPSNLALPLPEEPWRNKNRKSQKPNNTHK